MSDEISAPGDAADRGLAAEVSRITDEQWLAGHRALLASGDIPPEELGYLYEPGRDPQTVSLDELTTDSDPAEDGRG